MGSGRQRARGAVDGDGEAEATLCGFLQVWLGTRLPPIRRSLIGRLRERHVAETLSRLSLGTFRTAVQPPPTTRGTTMSSTSLRCMYSFREAMVCGCTNSFQW